MMRPPTEDSELKKEIDELKDNLPNGFTLRVSDDNPPRLDFEVGGAQETLKANKTYKFEIQFPTDYPMNAPQVTFKTPIPIHHQILRNGQIRDGALYVQWSPVVTLKSICDTIATMISSTFLKEKSIGLSNLRGSTGKGKRESTRLRKEIVDLQDNLPNGFMLRVSDDNPPRLDFEVGGAQETLEANKTYKFEIQFPNDYPMSAPQVTFKTPIPIHHQILRNGQIRDGALYAEWSPFVTLKSICNTIATMLSSTFLKEKSIGLANLRGSTDKGLKESGKRWAVLVAGSKGWTNSRHQANVCHAYQILRRGGLKEENIIVFMYDDIATNRENEDKGMIFNNRRGGDVYAGVPKDYNYNDVNAKNFYDVLLGSKIRRGSGKTLKSGPKDNVFIYYTNHGGSGRLEMPDGGKLYANEFMKVLEKMHRLKKYNKMVIYVSACFSGSMFKELKNNLNIYAMTSAHPTQKSYSTYGPPKDTVPGTVKYLKNPHGLSDNFSAGWLEHSETHDMSRETLQDQYEAVKRRVDAVANPRSRSLVSRYGAVEEMQKDYLDSFIGNTFNSASSSTMV